MNPRHRQQFFRAAAKWLCALLAVLALPVNGFAQPKKPERWLLVFDLSATMKKRLPATETALKNFFANGAEGRLQEGDNIGVWTYDQKMHGGQFPLAIWDPMQATTLTTNLAAFLRSRTYTGNSKLAALQPSLAGVVADSERLTIIIFCDGESDLTGTPYDSGINQSFLDGRAERKKSLQPFVVLIRTLSGKAIGCTVNFPPGAINIPPFLAPSPPTNTPPPPPVIIAVKPQPVVVPDLILVGTPASPATSPAPVIPPPVTNSTPAEVPKIIVVPVETPIPVAVPAPPAKMETSVAAPASNLVTAPPPAKMQTPLAVPATNTVAATTNDDSDPATRRLVFIGVGLLAAAVVLVVILIARPGRRPRSSLISSSMQDDPHRK